ncbi:hypothetical protein ACFOX0_17920 [Micromonospora zhanjiangensis]|uniref:Uncharacterized protein n=2 Tax=Micromonospora zhanjiangensis TaxID=1522057 RepID=A0ABV8KPJ7_9ACTN
MRGDLATVTPHTMHDGQPCGTWHCRLLSDPNNRGRVVVQEVVVDGDRWRNRMSTSVDVAALVPLTVQVDLFGNPVPVRLARR